MNLSRLLPRAEPWSPHFPKKNRALPCSRIRKSREYLHSESQWTPLQVRWTLNRSGYRVPPYAGGTYLVGRAVLKLECSWLTQTHHLLSVPTVCHASDPHDTTATLECSQDWSNISLQVLSLVLLIKHTHRVSPDLHHPGGLAGGRGSRFEPWLWHLPLRGPFGDFLETK